MGLVLNVILHVPRSLALREKCRVPPVGCGQCHRRAEASRKEALSSKESRVLAFEGAAKELVFENEGARREGVLRPWFVLLTLHMGYNPARKHG